MSLTKLARSTAFKPIPNFVRSSLRNACVESSQNTESPPYKPKKHHILATNLIVSYFEKGLVEEARSLFDEMPERDVVAWTAMITGYASSNYNASSWECFHEMVRQGTSPNEFTLSSVLKSCRNMKVLAYGALVHGVVVKLGMEGSLYVDNALMNMYATCSVTMEAACLIFRDIKVKNDVTWTTLITGFTHLGDGVGGLKMYKQMLLENADVTPYCITIAVKASASIDSVTTGKQIHASVIKRGFQSNLPVMNSILDLYCRCGYLSEAKRYFHDMEDKDLITWNTLISELERSDSSEALLMFQRFESQGFVPNCYTFTSLVAACANIAALNCGQQLHGRIYRRGFNKNVELANALIDMYAKCGDIPDSERVFGEIAERRNLVSWTSMMIGYGSHGYGAEAVELFDKMVSSGIRPDRIVFMAVLSACRHAGLVEKGLKYFNVMESEYGINPDRDIYNCVVDLLGRAGKIGEAYELVEKMPFKPDESTWGAILGACKVHKHTGLISRLAARKVMELKPRMVGTYVMLSYIYAAEGKWVEFARVRKMMRMMGNKKEAGMSWIEVENQVFSFAVSDKMCPNASSVYSVLGLLIEETKEAGYVPDLDSLVYDQEVGT
ncbi:Pentatricopeptide repeat [Arabidopsis suecica]|uniref:Pentatricopeptide repeat n=1 Tax=Arabidopsis suecica TaxID=45249 RepID=A0A8T2BNM6_ARASU|nr:Pentatricopeptide repeat [Arabidopsis suecica]